MTSNQESNNLSKKKMLIKEIVLNNFRIYQGENRIDVLPSDDKNIIVVSGQNGYGKTTFLMALVWCLYGKQTERVDEIYYKEIVDKNGGYNKYIGKSLNRAAELNKEYVFSVSITFKDVKIPEITCNEVKITRQYNVQTSEERVEVLIDGRINELVHDLRTEGKNDGEEVFIRDFILPIEIAKFFFFDAEKIVALSETNTIEDRRNLSKAYTEVLGIKKYEDLRETLESLQDDYRKKSATKEDEITFNNTETEVRNLEIKIDDAEDNILNLDNEKAEIRSEISEIQTKLVREGENMTVEELQDKKNLEQNLESKLQDIQESLREIYDLVPFGLAGGLMMDVSEQLSREKKFRDNKHNRESVTEKTSKIILDIEEAKKSFPSIITPEVRDFYEGMIKSLVSKYFFGGDDSEISPVNNPHEFSDSQTNEFNTLINNLIHSIRNSFTTKNEEYTRTKNELDAVRRAIRRAEKDSDDKYIAGLRETKNTLELQVKEIEDKVIEMKVEIANWRNDIKTQKQKLEALRQKIDTSRQYSKKEKKTQELIEQLKVFIKAFKVEKKTNLENNILTELQTLMHKKGFISKVTVDINQNGDDIDICLFDSKGKKIERSSLSMGERQMYSSALLKSLIDESDFEFPVFIDSPMQKFDKQHAENIIRDYYPNVSSQVVVFPLLHKELTEQEYQLMLPNVSKSYLIKSKGPDASTFEEIASDQLFNM